MVEDIHLSENPHRELTEFWVENYLTWDSLVMNCHAEVNFTICEHLPLISIDILMIFEGSYPLWILKISAWCLPPPVSQQPLAHILRNLFHGRRWIIRDIIIKERAQKSHLKSILIYVSSRKSPLKVTSFFLKKKDLVNILNHFF